MQPHQGLAARVLVAVFALTSVALAQETTGIIGGTVLDPAGAVIPGAMIEITNSATGRVVEVQSNAGGSFRAEQLPPSNYAMRVQATGFKTWTTSNVLVSVGRVTPVEVTMEVGQVGETVTVTESAGDIDINSSTVAFNIDAAAIERLPKPRGFQGLALLAPSVTAGAVDGGFQINGASAAENNYYIDGVSTNSVIDGSSRQTAIFEYLQEVQVKTNGLAAEYGGALGGVVSAVTKSGGNNWHGEAHYYFFGNALSAGPPKRLQLDPSTEKSALYVQDDKQSLNYNEPGFSLGGPLLRDRLYMFIAASPRWRRDSRDYNFSNGTEKGTLTRKAFQPNLFSKVSADLSSKVRANVSWLYTPSYLTGSLPTYDGITPNTSVRSLAAAQGGATRGYNQAETSYAANIDYNISPTSLLSVKGGRYFLNYKEVGIPYQKSYWWQASSVGLAGIPADLQQPLGYVTPSAAQTVFDLTTRTYINADYSKYLNLWGQHTIKLGVGTQKNVNSVRDLDYGPLGRTRLYWNQAFRGQRGTYGYYLVEDGGTLGSTGANITHIYGQDEWQIHRRLTLNLGIRVEKETIPSFRRDIQDKAFDFGFMDKFAPRLGAAFDVLGDGRLKISGGWGRFFDWTKYDLARGTFGGDTWNIYYRSLDTLDVYNLDLTNLPGRNLWAGEYRNLRIPGFDLLDPDIKPMMSQVANIGVQYEIRPGWVFTGRYNYNHLVRTIEDLGALDAEGNEVYRYGNPGEGANKIAPVSGLTCVISLPGNKCGFEMPKAVRNYDALELQLTKRFSDGYLVDVSYVFSRLYGNYSGLQSTDELRPSTLGYGFSGNQVFGAGDNRSGGNANRYFDLDEAMWDANGNVGLMGPLPTERPHQFKVFAAKNLPWNITLGGFFRANSGTPVTTQVTTINRIPLYVNGRGDLGRTPFFTQTDLQVAKEFVITESQRLRFEFNMDNLFNQKTSMFVFDRYNREEHPDSAGIDLHNTDLSKGFDWQAMVAATTDAAKGIALDPRYRKDAIFNAGFQGRFLVKYSF